MLAANDHHISALNLAGFPAMLMLWGLTTSHRQPLGRIKFNVEVIFGSPLPE